MECSSIENIHRVQLGLHQNPWPRKQHITITIFIIEIEVFHWIAICSSDFAVVVADSERVIYLACQPSRYYVFDV